MARDLLGRGEIARDLGIRVRLNWPLNRLRRALPRIRVGGLQHVAHLQRDSDPAESQRSAQRPSGRLAAQAAQLARFDLLHLLAQLRSVETVEEPFAKRPAGLRLGHRASCLRKQLFCNLEATGLQLK